MKLVAAFLFSLVGPVVSQETQVSSIRTDRELVICQDLKKKFFSYGNGLFCAKIKKEKQRNKFCEKMVTNISEKPPEGYLLKDKGRVFCPKACWECGLPPCEDDKKKKFSKKITKIKKCKNLAGKPQKAVTNICEVFDKNAKGLVKDFCRKTCNNCVTTSRPTNIKTSRPTTVPTVSFRCFDHDTFAFAIGKKNAHLCII